MALEAQVLEREAELDGLQAAVDALVRDGTAGAVLVTGAPGMGKTVLLDVLAARAVGRGAAVLRAAGAELEFELAFGGVRQLFGPVLRLPVAERDALLEGPAALARAVLGLPVAGGAPADLSGDPLYGLYWLAANLTERAPLVLVIDDAHWLDTEARRWVTYTARRRDGMRLLLVAAARPGGRGHRRPGGRTGRLPAPGVPRVGVLDVPSRTGLAGVLEPGSVA